MSTKWWSGVWAWTTTATRAARQTRARRRVDASASNAASSHWCMPASAATPTALCHLVRRWREWCSTPRVASARPTEAAPFASNSSHCAATMPSTARRTSALCPSASISSTSCGSSRFSSGCSRHRWCAGAWHSCRAEECRKVCPPQLPQEVWGRPLSSCSSLIRLRPRRH